jgi:ABC-type cobalamin/Fe3+-siderophores transport system ATPase subunit
MVGVSIDRLIFNDGTEIGLSPTDIVVFVGPNNAGKSRSLKDIYGLLSSPHGSIVVRDVVRRIHNLEGIKENVKGMSLALRRADQTYEYHGYHYNIYQDRLNEIERGNRLNEGIRAFLVSNVKTEERLETANPKDVIDRNQPKQNPLQYMTDETIREAVSQVFLKIFQKNVYCYDKASRKIYLHIGPEIRINQGGMLVSQISDAYYERMRNLPALHEQGDGVRSLAGLLMNLMMPNYSMFLLDEPEAFLHPPQARTLGNALPELLNEKQAFISTHSIDLIKGLLSSAPQRVKIVRITRDGDTNHIKSLNQNDIDTIWNDPIMRHSNMLDSLFYEHTILCESDSDCQLYSLVLEHQKEQQRLRTDTLFIHCGGKGRMHLIIKELKALGVDYRVIPDLDVFNDRDLVRRIVTESGGDWLLVEQDYNTVAAAMNLPDGTMSEEKFIAGVRAKIAERGYQEISKTEANRLSKDVKGLLDNRWDALKHQGMGYIQEGNVRNALERLIEILNGLKVYPVKVGELENFIPQVGNHGPGWAMNVIAAYPNLNDPIYGSISDFVRSWNV